MKGATESSSRETSERKGVNPESKPILNTYSESSLVMLPMLSGIVPVSWLLERALQQWVGGDTSEGPNGDVRELE